MTNNDRNLRYLADGQTGFAIMIRSLALKAYGNYVMDSLDDAGLVTEQSTPAMGVTITSGTATINGSAADTVSGNHTIGTAHTTLDRYDLVIYDVSASTGAVVAGTAAASPQVPSPGEARDIPLAIVRVRAAVTKIFNEDIIDVRA